jgi:hypothetical protein
MQLAGATGWSPDTIDGLTVRRFWKFLEAAHRTGLIKIERVNG